MEERDTFDANFKHEEADDGDIVTTIVRSAIDEGVEPSKRIKRDIYSLADDEEYRGLIALTDVEDAERTRFHLALILSAAKRGEVKIVQYRSMDTGQVVPDRFAVICKRLPEPTIEDASSS